jgi:hypothetical protein
MNQESGLKSGLLNDAIFIGVIQFLQDNAENENRAAEPVVVITHYALRTTHYVLDRQSPCQAK